MGWYSFQIIWIFSVDPVKSDVTKPKQYVYKSFFFLMDLTL